MECRLKLRLDLIATTCFTCSSCLVEDAMIRRRKIWRQKPCLNTQPT